jgi:hypothetical protein
MIDATISRVRMHDLARLGRSGGTSWGPGAYDPAASTIQRLTSR